MKKNKTPYQETLDYLFSQLPMYQRQGATAMKKDLGNILALCKHLGQPEKAFPSIHIAGTNGKGSSTHILSAILQKKRKKVGVYTSPHYMDFRERVKINNELMPEQFVVDFVTKNKPIFNEIRPSFFEMTVAMAFQYFAEQNVDIAIIETGLGGRLDSTNIINPILSLITNISFDHQQLLGDTLPKIAAEKAGIIKENTPVVISEDNEETAAVFLEQAAAQNADIYFAKDTFQVVFTKKGLTHTIFNVYKDGVLFIQDVKTDIIGAFQAENFRGIFQVLEVLNKNGWNITETDIRNALAHIKTSTYFLGRMQTLGESPLIIADSGHNEAAFLHTLKEIKAKNQGQLHIVLGFVKDKEVSKVLAHFPKSAHYYFTNANIPRALPANELLSLAEPLQLKGAAYTSVQKALKTAKLVAQKEDIIFVGGSIFVVAEILNNF